MLLDELHVTWMSIDGWLNHQSSSETVIPSERMTELNDQAWFVLLFGLLEDHINTEYEQQVGPWEEAAFNHRVNCIFVMDAANAELIKSYYMIRCEIAHGRISPRIMHDPIHMPDVFEKIQYIITR